MAVNALKLSGTTGETTFSDNSNIAAWAKASVRTAINNDIMRGYPNHAFKPQSYTTSAEALSVILSLVK